MNHAVRNKQWKDQNKEGQANRRQSRSSHYNKTTRNVKAEHRKCGQSH